MVRFTTSSVTAEIRAVIKANWDVGSAVDDFAVDLMTLSAEDLKTSWSLTGEDPLGRIERTKTKVIAAMGRKPTKEIRFSWDLAIGQVFKWRNESIRLTQEPRRTRVLAEFLTGKDRGKTYLFPIRTLIGQTPSRVVVEAKDIRKKVVIATAKKGDVLMVSGRRGHYSLYLYEHEKEKHIAAVNLFNPKERWTLHRDSIVKVIPAAKFSISELNMQ